MNNGRPLSVRKKVQLLVGLTILAWATQTLLAQWTRGAEVDARENERPASFVPRDGAAASSATLELRGEARVYGADVKLRQVCRWSETDAATFAPLADLVLTKLEPRRPYKVIDARDVRQTLEEAGINVALLRLAGAAQCTVSRSDSELNEGEALAEWVKAHEAKTTGKTVAKTQAASKAAVAAKGPAHEEPVARTLRDLLTSDLAVRLSIPVDELVLAFDPRDETALNLSEPQFTFHLYPRRAKDLGDVLWDVTIGGPTGSRKVPIRATARAWQDQLVVAKPLSRRQVIQASDLSARRTLVDQLSNSAVLGREQIVGQMASRDLKPGAVMTASLVDAVPLARPGQFISVTLERGTVRIKTVAKAMEGGSYGETIRVKNEATRDTYQVVLIGPQEATMAPAASSAPAPVVALKK